MSVWVGGSVADVKQPQAVLPIKYLTLTLLPASPSSIFIPFCSRLMALSDRKRGGRQWRLTELNGLICYVIFIISTAHLRESLPRRQKQYS